MQGKIMEFDSHVTFIQCDSRTASEEIIARRKLQKFIALSFIPPLSCIVRKQVKRIYARGFKVSIGAGRKNYLIIVICKV